MKSRIRLARFFFFSSSALLLMLILALGLIWGVGKYRDLQSESRRIAASRIESGRRLIRQQVDRTISFLEYKNRIPDRRLKAELQENALAQFRHVRYSDDGYIFILRSDGRVLSHPDARLIGKNLFEFSKPPHAHDGIARLIKASKRPEGGESRYLCPRLSGGPAVLKLTYVKAFAPWDWIVGTGIYLDDIEREIAAAEADYRDILIEESVSGALLFASFFLLSLVIYRFVAGRMNAELASLTGFFNRAAASHEKIDPDELKFHEFSIIGASANRLVDDFLAVEADNQEIKKIIDSTPAVVFRWKNEPGWPVEIVTQNAGKVFGYTAADFLSGRIKYEDVLHPDDRQRVAEEVAARSRQADIEAFSQEYRIIAADGSVRWVDDRTHIRRDEYGRIAHYQGVVVDVSDLKALEHKHRELEKQYGQAQKMEAIGRLAGGMAHDFNNLLTVILGYADILTNKTDNDHPNQEELAQIKGAAFRAKELTTHLMVFSRKQHMKMAVVDINETVAASGRMLGRIIGDDIELHVFAAPESLFVMADVTQIDQILMNLAVNARDAMADGGTLTIETQKRLLDATYTADKADVAAGTYAMIGVTDTGSGMDEAVKARIFEPFFTTKAPEKGTGLGLATCYGIVKQHGGHLFCYSEPGRGTTFKIYLPLVPALPESKTESPVPPAKPPFSATVLVIEDEPAVLNLTSEILSHAGYMVLQADHPKAALEVVANTDGAIDLVVTDIVMPEMKGQEIVAEVLKRHPGAAVIYMSGYSHTAMPEGTKLPDDVRYIQKPFSAQRLLEQVAAALT